MSVTHCAYQPCGRGLTKRQQQGRQRFCSLSCAGRRNRNRTPIERQAVLAILEANAGRELGWLTLSDLAILRYGDDSPSDTHAVRMSLMHLRKRGHVIESRPAFWAAGMHSLAYRLVAPAHALGVAA